MQISAFLFPFDHLDDECLANLCFGGKLKIQTQKLKAYADDYKTNKMHMYRHSSNTAINTKLLHAFKYYFSTCTVRYTVE